MGAKGGGVGGKGLKRCRSSDSGKAIGEGTAEGVSAKEQGRPKASSIVHLGEYRGGIGRGGWGRKI